MSLVRLRTFIEVYRFRSLSSAARNLNLTQPAISQHISGLEVAIGRRLFERGLRGVTPTAAADELAADIGNKLDEVEGALSSARYRSAELAGTVQLVCHPDFQAEVLSPRLVPILKSGIRLRLHLGSSDVINKMVLDGNCDLGVTAFPSADKHLHRHLLTTDLVSAITSPGVLERMKRVGNLEAALGEEPLLAHSIETPLVNVWLKEQKLTPHKIKPAVICQDLRTIRALISREFGWTVLPNYLCKQELKKKSIVRIPTRNVQTKLDYYLIWISSALRRPRVSLTREILLRSFWGGNGESVDTEGAARE